MRSWCTTSNAWGAPYTGKSSDQVSVTERGRAGCWSCDWAVPPQDGSACCSRIKQGWSWLHFSKWYQIVYKEYQPCRGMQERIPGRHSAQLMDMTLVHEAGGIVLWALLPWFMVCAQLVRAAGSSVLQCGLPDCLGVCSKGFNDPRLAPQAFKPKSFHDLY